MEAINIWDYLRESTRLDHRKGKREMVTHDFSYALDGARTHPTHSAAAVRRERPCTVG